MRVVASKVGREMATRAATAVAVVALALAWAGTHLLGQTFATTPDFPASRWGLGLGLIAASGLLTGSLLRPIDVKAQFNRARALPIAVLPLLVLAYSYAVLEFDVQWMFLHRLAGWATPFGHSALAFMVGIGAAAGMSAER